LVPYNTVARYLYANGLIDELLRRAFLGSHVCCLHLTKHVAYLITVNSFFFYVLFYNLIPNIYGNTLVVLLHDGVIFYSEFKAKQDKFKELWNDVLASPLDWIDNRPAKANGSVSMLFICLCLLS
jgi:hypothetical protein